MRTLNDIVPPSKRKDFEQPRPAVEPLILTPNSPRHTYTTIIISLAVIAVAVGALFYFSSAKVKVVPTVLTSEVQTTLSLQKDSADIPYKILTTQKIASNSVKGSGTKSVESSASGTITIYNTQTSSQKLITNTRFSASGVIFRIHAPVTVPGGSVSKPGSVSVKVFADKPGSASNIGPSSFTIPGFAGMPQEGKVYARSTAPMTGGSSGNVPVVDTALEEATRDTLQKALEPDLLASIESQIPADYTLLKGATSLSYQPVESEPSATEGMVEIKEQGSAIAIVFDTQALARALASSSTALSYLDEPITLGPASSLTFSSVSGLPTEDSASYSFTVNGTASFVYVVDPARIAAAVSGRSREEATTALDGYPEIKSAYVILRPFWRQTLPQDPSAIAVVILEPEAR